MKKCNCQSFFDPVEGGGILDCDNTIYAYLVKCAITKTVISSLPFMLSLTFIDISNINIGI